MSLRSRVRLVMTGLTLAVSASACAPLQRTLRGYADAPMPELEQALAESALSGAPVGVTGQMRFVLDDFGSLDTDLLDSYGVPWKLAAAALVLRRAQRDGSPLNQATLRRVLGEFGFLFPERVVNWTGRQPARSRRPIGLLSGVASRGLPAVELEIAGLGCASCHSGVTYDERGMPTADVWVGLPNTSLDLTAYGDSLFVALRAALLEPDPLLDAVRTLYPDVSEREMSTLRRHAIPRGRARLEELNASWGRALPFVNGGPGITNGVASLLHRLGLPVQGPAANAFVSIPFLGDRQMRSSLLADGVYAFPGEARFAPRAAHDVSPAQLDAMAAVLAFFTVPTQGASPETARRAITPMKDVVRFIAELRPPRFPGSVDSAGAAVGETIYRGRCARCHGETSPGLRDVKLTSLPNLLVPQREMGTDPDRWRAADSASLPGIREIGFARWIEAATTGGYVAPPLTGVWATAPYLHNGSVPTLWQLMNPELRPERFQVGGHALDYREVGIAGAVAADGVYRYPQEYRAWSQPAVYDTRLPGRRNTGHERMWEGLSAAQKWALIEYLKVL